LQNLKPKEGREHLGLEHFLRRARQFDEKVEAHQVIVTSPGKGCTVCLRIPRRQIKKFPSWADYSRAGSTVMTNIPRANTPKTITWSRFCVDK
jgi:hypothetical protein